MHSPVIQYLSLTVIRAVFLFFSYLQASLASLCRGTGESQWTSATRKTLKLLRDMSSSTWAGLQHLSFMETTLKWWKTSLVSEALNTFKVISVSGELTDYFLSAGRKSVQQGLGTSRLPTFSPQEKSYIKGTCDFLGIGHFTTRYITQKNYPSVRSSSSYFTDRDLAELVDPRWPDPGSEWLYAVPWGFRRLLNFVKVSQSWHLFICASRVKLNESNVFHVTLICSPCRYSMETQWFMWLRTESRRRCCAQSCVTNGGYSTIKTTSMRCSKVNEATHAAQNKENVSHYIYIVMKLAALCVTQLSKTESMWRATLHGHCWTSSSGTKGTRRDLACTTWTSGIKTSLAIPKPLFSFTNASSAPTDFPIRERWGTERSLQRPEQISTFLSFWIHLDVGLWSPTPRNTLSTDLL